MARALWSGAISFGLLNIPVAVLSAKEVKVGDVEAAAEFEEAPRSTDTNSADLMALLQKSIGKKQPKAKPSHRLH